MKNNVEKSGESGKEKTKTFSTDRRMLRLFYSRQWKSRNKAHCKLYQLKWRLKNGECEKERRRLWRKANPEKVKEFNQKSYKKNTAQCIRSVKSWQKRNLGKMRIIKLCEYKKQMSTACGRLRNRMRSLVRHDLRKNKQGRRWESLVGYTVEDLHKHLEAKFTDGMNWTNMAEWHIDHVVPQCRFHYNIPEDPEFKVCWGLDNLQPMWAMENIIKGSKSMEEYLDSK